MIQGSTSLSLFSGCNLAGVFLVFGWEGGDDVSCKMRNLAIRCMTRSVRD
ncbi:hypothetical protein RchiOBHm_Chr1g0359201 [Rosa chinensis]|uniref:Uncharacterized protein n=1 Tax=Rosa chinensis TaxID=74649 RepID=A0A2P6SIF4_ROSCH|nr:hypothetical protein RchiOBHm_Chr1g0359201 [Rosa chinensis]